MKNYDMICYGCFEEKTAPGVCPRCSYDPAATPHPVDALPLGSILNGRYLSGRVAKRTAYEFVYVCFDMTLENKLLLHEYAPVGITRDASDPCTIRHATSAADYDFRQAAKDYQEHAKALLRVKETPDQPALTDFFDENATYYYVTEYRDQIRTAPGSIPQTAQTSTQGEAAHTAVPAAHQPKTAEMPRRDTYPGEHPLSAPQSGKKKAGLIGAIIAAAACCVLIPLIISGTQKKDVNPEATAQTSAVSASSSARSVAPTETVTPAPTDAPTPEAEPTGTPGAGGTGATLDATFTSSKYAYEIQYPSTATVDDSADNMDLFQLGNETRLIIMYSAFEGIPLYDAADVMRDPQLVLDKTLEGLDGYEMVDSMLSDDGSYATIDYNVRGTNGIYQGYVVCKTCDNAPGCHIFTAVYPAGDMDSMNTTLAMLKSFHQTGDVPHGLEVSGGSKEGVRIITAAGSHAGEIHTNENVANGYPMLIVDVSVNADGTVTTQRFDGADGTPKDYIQALSDMLTSQQGFQVVSDPYTADRAERTYDCVDLVQQAGDQSYIVTYAACEESGSMILITAEQIVHENQKTISDSISTVFADVMDTVQLVS